MLGLFCFFYASLHLLVWLVLDQSLSLENMLYGVPESPYIILGLLAYTMLLPLALTSNLASMRLLGQNWQALHRTVYLIAVLGLIHFFWLTKLDNTEPIIYALVLGVLLAFRWPIIKRLWHR
jgi:Predicted membrane protein